MENKTIPPMYPTEFVERELGIRTDCYNHSCPFRVNDTSSASRCECTACPNRCTGDFSIAWNRTLTDEELAKGRIKCADALFKPEHWRE